MITPPNLSLLLIMVCFWIVFILVWALLVRPLGAILDERERKVASARETLDGVRASVAEAVSAYERDLAVAASEAQKERASLRSTGEASRREQLEAARERAQQRLAALAVELDQATGNAKDELRTRTEILARALAERLIGRRLAT